jgi:hypothetical protein
VACRHAGLHAAEGVVLNAGTHELVGDLHAGDANYAASTKTVSLTVTPAATTIT